MDALLTIDELATELKRPVATLRWWRHNGDGPLSAIIGGRITYRRSDVQKWLDEQFAQADADRQAAIS